MEKVEIDPEHVEQLKTSKLKFGAIAPIIVDAHGNIVDGFHRREADSRWPTVTYEEIKTEEDRVLYAIASNWHRKEKSSKWKSRMITWLAKQGCTPQEISQKTRLKLRTVYKYLPEEFKEKEKVEAGRLGGEVVAARRAAKVEVHEYKPKETPEYRRARMHPAVSKMEQAVTLKLHQKGLHPEVQQEFILLTTKPDWYFAKQGKAFYLDHEKTHKDRQTRDEYLRGLLKKRHNIEPIGITYRDTSQKTEDEILNKIMSALAESEV